MTEQEVFETLTHLRAAVARIGALGGPTDRELLEARGETLEALKLIMIAGLRK